MSSLPHSRYEKHGAFLYGLLFNSSVLWVAYGLRPFKHRNGGFESCFTYGYSLTFHSGGPQCIPISCLKEMCRKSRLQNCETERADKCLQWRKCCSFIRSSPTSKFTFQCFTCTPTLTQIPFIIARKKHGVSLITMSLCMYSLRSFRDVYNAGINYLTMF